MDSKAGSLIKIHTAVLFFGLAGVFGKMVDLPATIIVLGRVFFATLFLAAFLLFMRGGIRLNRGRDYLYMALQGAILAIHWATFFQSVLVSTVAVGLLTHSTFPIFAAFLEPMFFKERLAFSDVALAMITLLGVALVVPSFELANNITQGVLWGTASGFTFAILSILNRKYVREYASPVIAFYQDGIATVLLMPFFFLLKPDVKGNEWLLLIILGVVCTAIAHSLFIKGLTHVKARTASIIASLEPVYGILAAVLLLGEVPGLRVMLGGAVILTATFYATLGSRG